MNAPDRFELFLLSEGEKKIEEEVQSSIANCSDFIIKKEDHTIGNLLAEHLKKHQRVLMAAYKVSHPNVPDLFIRVQTDGSITPREAFMDSCRLLLRMLKQLSEGFTREWELRRVVTAGDQQGQGQPGQGYHGL